MEHEEVLGQKLAEYMRCIRLQQDLLEHVRLLKDDIKATLLEIQKGSASAESVINSNDQEDGDGAEH